MTWFAMQGSRQLYTAVTVDNAPVLVAAELVGQAAFRQGHDGLAHAKQQGDERDGEQGPAAVHRETWLHADSGGHGAS